MHPVLLEHWQYKLATRKIELKISACHDPVSNAISPWGDGSNVGRREDDAELKAVRP